VSTVLIAGGGTGGHLMPALALAGALSTADPGRRVVLVGAQRGIEARLLPTRGFPFRLLPAEPIYRRQWWKNLRWAWVFERLRREVSQLLDQERPGLVLGTGGYASGPVVWWAARRGIPTAILELDAMPGITTRWLARRVRQVFLGVPEAAARIRPGPETVVSVTGAPIATPDRTLSEGAARRLGIDRERPVLLIAGGSQGSAALNEAVAAWVQSGASSGLQLLWATGHATWDRYRRLHAPPGVQVTEFLDPISEAYSVASLAVTRAGSMTLAELCAWGIPAILVPLPTAASDHQMENARVMTASGAATLVRQRELTPERLGQEVRALLQDPSLLAQMASQATSRGRPEATRQILTLLEGLTGVG
jgi:UDP-N-acetylglucosamine--N-acetylmuramyl-(pentapeptide) pyrophosphoryl-undecaprenol N-acetylglucosamine transferase